MGVTVENMAPPLKHVASFCFGALNVIRISASTPRNRFLVIELCVGRPDYPINGLADAQAQIDIVVRHGQISLIEAADLIEYCYLHYQAGGGHCREILRYCRTPKVTEISSS